MKSKITETQIQKIAQQLNNYVAWENREEIANTNRSFFSKVFESDMVALSTNEAAKPLFDVLSNGNSNIAVTKYETVCPAGKPENSVYVDFDGQFELLFNWTVDTKDCNEYNDGETVIMYERGELTEEEWMEIECVFGEKCDHICYMISEGCLTQTPVEPEISEGHYWEAQNFFENFGKYSNYHQVIVTALTSEFTFEETYIVEASSEEEAKIKTLSYLVPDATQLDMYEDNFCLADDTKHFTSWEISHLTESQYQAMKHDHMVINQSLLRRPEPKDLDLTLVSAPEHEIDHIKSVVECGESSGLNVVLIDYEWLKHDELSDLNDVERRDITEVATSLGLAPKDAGEVMGKTILAGDVETGDAKGTFYNVNLAIFKHFMQFEKSAKKYTFDGERAVYLDVRDDVDLKAELQKYVGIFDTPFVALYNASITY